MHEMYVFAMNGKPTCLELTNAGNKSNVLYVMFLY